MPKNIIHQIYLEGSFQETKTRATGVKEDWHHGRSRWTERQCTTRPKAVHPVESVRGCQTRAPPSR
eukprot:8325650-Pyramimonas_sp.AAC.1